MNDPSPSVKTTCLYDEHLALNARMVDFAGWSMPIQYGSILEEHRAVRNAAGMFDVSHMGRVEFSGRDCVPYLQRLFTCDVAKLEPGQARYTLLCAEDGGILDDTILYCRSSVAFTLVCNAGNTPAVLAWLEHWREPFDITLTDRTAATGMIALQGPGAAAHLAALAGPAVPGNLPYFRWVETTVAGIDAFVARTGYTGEDGFEFIVPAETAPGLWRTLRDRGVTPIALGARDTLRLEAALPLHGNDISLKTNPVQAGLMWAVAMDKGPFLGKEAIERSKASGPSVRLVGFGVTGRGIPRAHCPLLLPDGTVAGEATSGGFSPTLQKGIGMGYIAAAHGAIGTEIAVDIRGAITPARVVRRPFYRRPQG
ncbi:MAG: glycine cleavage system aminomethyltransferase GcvT [Dehalococcoidia bacterium]|nr:glycine cleavage system aminomethyltransferase GcvT [Dehalococcoidia bacterium]